MLKIVFFVPESHLNSVKHALFAKGAGQSNGYSHCCWQVQGQMQYMPEQGSDPTIGKSQELVMVNEYRVEMVCPEALIGEVITELKRTHPYEIPAYEIYRLEMDPLNFMS